MKERLNKITVMIDRFNADHGFEIPCLVFTVVVF